MFLERKEKLILIIVLFLVVIIPLSSYAIAYRFKAQTQALADVPLSPKVPTKTTTTTTSALDELRKQLSASSSASDLQTATEQTFYGPTLNFKINLDGRPTGKMASKIFVGLVSGSEITPNPQFILSFMVDVPNSGEYSGLSLAGLTQGSTYTAFIKGPSQIATSSSFFVRPTINDIGTQAMLSGDLNDDNKINDTDYQIALKAYGSTKTSPKWNSLADFNVDGIVNMTDIGIMSKNLEKSGTSGQYTSPVSGSADSRLTPNTGGPTATDSAQGYWIFIPR